MIRITLKPTDERIHITYGGMPINIPMLRLGDNRVQNLSDMIHSLRDDNGEKIAFLAYKNEKVAFFRHNGGYDTPVYVKRIHPELLSELKQLESQILLKISDLADNWELDERNMGS